ncbi:hypothetical protein CVT25_002181 [Psilocybe cyanescens]|uniref:Uncharacterized protein n=1 Tax=Psilocybe cyanescens TaxID=93625 RepID=A0A409XF83_PSICY|nr:hypothetical protein CVT25_002181 [Psilocybe cyanescens]
MPHLFSIKHIKSTFFSSSAPQNTSFITSEPSNTQDNLQEVLEKLEADFVKSMQLEKQAHDEGKRKALQWAQKQSEGYQLQIKEMKKKISPSLTMKVDPQLQSLRISTIISVNLQIIDSS